MLPEPALTVVGVRYDRARIAALAEPSADELAGLIAALANSSGGFVILGADLDPETGATLALPGVRAEAAKAAVREALSAVDPPADHLVSMQEVQAPDGGVPLLLVAVRQSPSPPHLVVPDGRVLLSVPGGRRTVRSRAELDALYQRGRAERERADRQIDAMIEKLLQSHYAFYGIGVVACTQHPTAEPYLWARENLEALTQSGEPFLSAWELSADLIKARPGDVELRGEREVFGYLRLTRGGCVAVGEVRRRPPGNTIGTIEDVLRRIGAMVELGCGLLAHASGVAVVPRLFFEGLRSQRVVVGEQPYAESAAVDTDTAQLPANIGDPGDAEYRRRLKAELGAHLLGYFKVELEDPTDLVPDEA